MIRGSLQGYEYHIENTDTTSAFSATCLSDTRTEIISNRAQIPLFTANFDFEAQLSSIFFKFQIQISSM
jgi:hypothetical protein